MNEDEVLAHFALIPSGAVTTYGTTFRTLCKANEEVDEEAEIGIAVVELFVVKTRGGSGTRIEPGAGASIIVDEGAGAGGAGIGRICCVILS